LELGLHGRRCLLIDRSDRTSASPRAKTTNVRTRELMRRWGIAQRLADLSPFGVGYASDAVFATSMRGPELARFRNAMYCHPARDDRYAEHGQWIPQNLVERVLQDAVAGQATVDVRRPASLERLSEDHDGVTATLQDADGTRSQVRARYLVGADGARSTVREQLGIAMEGVSPLGHHRNHIFRAPDLHGLHRLGEAAMYWLVHAQHASVLSPLDARDLWVFSCSRGSGDDDPAAMIRSAIGLELPIDIVAQDDWTAHQLLAKRYGTARVFLIGDACHLHPPFGGHGMNMGIADGVDLGWKLAGVLAGWGGPALLGSYEVERGQVHRRVMAESVSNHKLLAASFHRPGLDKMTGYGARLRAEVGEAILAAKKPEFDSLGLVIGCHYEASPILLREPKDAPPRAAQPVYESCARPGCRAPHLWLEQGVAPGASLYDRFNRTGFTLLVTSECPGPANGVRPLLEAAAVAGVPIDVVAPKHPDLPDLYGATFALIRPDQHVAWRGDDVGHALEAIEVARGAIQPAEASP
jgi:2-polyprenyl-6-methoxyphenol hydroxylase-like FAD-dependent oxidoreductase